MGMLSEYDKAEIQTILRGHGDWFTAQLLRLIAKADEGNKEKLRLGFPAEVELVEKYRGW